MFKSSKSLASKLTQTMVNQQKKQQILKSFVDIYLVFLNNVLKVNNDVNIETLITMVEMLKKHNPKKIYEMWDMHIYKMYYDKISPNFDVDFWLLTDIESLMEIHCKQLNNYDVGQYRSVIIDMGKANQKILYDQYSNNKQHKPVVIDMMKNVVQLCKLCELYNE